MGYAGLVWVALAPLLAARAKRSVVWTTVLTAATVWAADLLAGLLKLAVGRARPSVTVPEADPLLGGTLGNAFPSGHASTSFAGAVILALTLRRAVPLLVLLAVAIAFSRVYVGVHYPLDVLAGAILGTAVAVGAAAAAGRLRALRTPSAARRRSGAAPPPG